MARSRRPSTLRSLKTGDVTEKLIDGVFIFIGYDPNSTVFGTQLKTDAAGWKADHDCKLIAADGNLKVTITGRDPYITTNVEAKKAPLVLRFNAKFPKAGTGQVFWWTKNRLQPDERDQAQFAIQEGAADYEVRFKSDDELVGLRIDPGDAAGEGVLGLDHHPLPSDGRARGGRRCCI